jgi:hypothetical protein
LIQREAARGRCQFPSVGSVVIGDYSKKVCYTLHLESYIAYFLKLYFYRFKDKISRGVLGLIRAATSTVVLLFTVFKLVKALVS